MRIARGQEKLPRAVRVGKFGGGFWRRCLGRRNRPERITLAGTARNRNRRFIAFKENRWNFERRFPRRCALLRGRCGSRSSACRYACIGFCRGGFARFAGFYGFGFTTVGNGADE